MTVLCACAPLETKQRKNYGSFGYGATCGLCGLLDLLDEACPQPPPGASTARWPPTRRGAVRFYGMPDTVGGSAFFSGTMAMYFWPPDTRATTPSFFPSREWW